jgi:hypothetical protein
MRKAGRSLNVKQLEAEEQKNHQDFHWWRVVFRRVLQAGFGFATALTAVALLVKGTDGADFASEHLLSHFIIPAALLVDSGMAATEVTTGCAGKT